MFRSLTEKLAEELQRHLDFNEAHIPTRELQLALQAALAKLDVVTREEFDAQTAVLARTRLRLEELEQHLSRLENHGGSN